MISAVLMANNSALRDYGRWALRSDIYKSQLLSLPAPNEGELRHMEWDGWGFAGMDTTVYLAFDPDDMLASQIKDHSAGKFIGIPCEVPRVRRLENHWYAVLYFTDSSWDRCD
jgi:hypothetical protein